MIEIRTRVDSSILIIDGRTVAAGRASNAGGSCTFDVEDPTATTLLYACEFGDLPSTIDRIFLSSCRTELMEHNPTIVHRKHADIYSHADTYSIEVLSFIELESWNQMYTPASFLRELKPVFATYPGIEITEIRSESFGAEIILYIDNPKIRIGDSIQELIQFLEASELKAITQCLNEEKGGSLATYFSFPPEIKSACEQYLLYFGQFLRDVGINASVEIKDEADRVLFSVTPADSREALDRIRRVLDLYLGLPAATFTIAGEDREYRLESQRLESQVMHLKSQLMLAQATLETKNATIELQRDRLIYQGQLVEGRLLPGPNPPEKPEAEKEEILDGIVEIKKYEGKGINVNLPKLFRGLRGGFKRDKEKS